MSVRPTRSEPENRKLLMALMTRHQRQVFGYIYTLVPDRAAAEDLLQETCVVICEKFEEFEEQSDFVAWACRIALWRVRQSRQRFARSKVFYDQEVVDAVAKTAAAMAAELDVRHAALAECLEVLPERERTLVLTRYESGAGVEEAARRTGRTLPAAYKALARVRKMLTDCVTRRLTTGGNP